MIKFENVGVVYPGGVKALDNINLEINEGDFVIIVGLSGAGKSTLLRSINNLVKPTDGNVTVDGNNVTNASKKELPKIIIDQSYKMRFDTNTNGSLAWNFYPEVNTLNLKPGEIKTVIFLFKNKTKEKWRKKR